MDLTGVKLKGFVQVILGEKRSEEISRKSCKIVTVCTMRICVGFAAVFHIQMQKLKAQTIQR